MTSKQKQVWTVEEDEKLKEVVKQRGQSGWNEVAQNLPERTAKQCRDRWFNHLKPCLTKACWTSEEDDILFQAQEKFGNSWSRIATECLPGRTDLQVKNRFYSTLRRQERRQKRKRDFSVVKDELQKRQIICSESETSSAVDVGGMASDVILPVSSTFNHDTQDLLLKFLQLQPSVQNLLNFANVPVQRSFNHDSSYFLALLTLNNLRMSIQCLPFQTQYNF